jgi:hypothetical protein
LRHADEQAECLLIGVHRKWPTCAQNVEIDPKLGLSIDILVPAAAHPLRLPSLPAAPAQPFGT